MMSKTIQELNLSLNEISRNNPSFSENVYMTRSIETLNGLASAQFVNVGEPTRILGDFEGSGNDWNRLLSFVRERSEESELLKSKLREIQSGNFSK